MRKNDVYEYILSLKGTLDHDFGCDVSEVQQRIDDAYSLFFGKAICVVTDWVWIDIELTKEEMRRFPNDLKPMLLFADTILRDSPNRGIDWVITSMLSEYRHPGLFVTRNTCYVIVGLGLRCKLSFSDFALLVNTRQKNRRK
ncbi:hypothetical protein [Moritella sp. Urea-trap-13]|uniref:DUF6957 family protein n=1 Tax=Moritella sp. Urea-trap-13 TaxID=2058327 RepID=UPI000C3304C1|nr:hypothetical protein [Moritella sp. Urea-trap-13]PKH08187.1 hypothetical protein CXF93_05800 [Moritella sp. Urea-trap-13]